MSRMGELSQVLDEMVACGEGMIKAAKEIKEIFSEPAEAADTPAAKPDALESASKPASAAVTEQTAAPKQKTAEAAGQQAAPEPAKQTEPEPAQQPQPETYSFEEVRKACAAKSHAGFTSQVRELIHKYGSDRLSGIKQESYPSLMHDLEVIR